MRLFLVFAVTISFLAGQACESGVRAFHPLRTEENVKLMSGVMQCGTGMDENITGTSADCGSGKCMEGVKDQPDDVATATTRMEVPAILVAPHAIGAVSSRRKFIAHEQRGLRQERPAFTVRRE